MDANEISHHSYTTTPLKSEGSSNSTARRQVYDRTSSNPYKTPVRCKVNQIIQGNLTKPNAFNNNVIQKMPIYTPPPKNVSFVKNPFEHARFLKERLSQPICSPSLFQNIVSPSQTDNFSWSIEDISLFRPAQIDENPSQDFDSWFSPATENEAQEAINRFFASQTINMESPLLMDSKKSMSRDVMAPREKPPVTDTWTQTVCSLPPVLPPEVEQMLSSYCTFTASQWNQNGDDLNSSNSSLSRKKLLFDDVNTSNAAEDADLSCCTPQPSKNESFRRTDASTPITSQLSSPELSPISSNAHNSPEDNDISMRSKSAVRLNLTNDIEMLEKENVCPKDWTLQGCSTPRASAASAASARFSDSAFSSL